MISKMRLTKQGLKLTIETSIHASSHPNARTILVLVHNRRTTVIHAIPRKTAQTVNMDLESRMGTRSIGTVKRFFIMSLSSCTVRCSIIGDGKWRKKILFNYTVSDAGRRTGRSESETCCASDWRFGGGILDTYLV